MLSWVTMLYELLLRVYFSEYSLSVHLLTRSKTNNLKVFPESFEKADCIWPDREKYFLFCIIEIELNLKIVRVGASLWTVKEGLVEIQDQCLFAFIWLALWIGLFDQGKWWKGDWSSWTKHLQRKSKMLESSIVHPRYSFCNLRNIITLKMLSPDDLFLTLNSKK